MNITLSKVGSIQYTKRYWPKLKHAKWWFSRSKSAVIGTFIVGLAFFFAVFGPWFISPHPYKEINLSKRLTPPACYATGSWDYPLGTDDLGRCILSRIIYATRIALLVGGTVTLLAATVGTMLGLISGYFGGWVDVLIMRTADIQWSFPYLLLAIVVMGLLGTQFINLILVLMISGWVSYARTVRGVVNSLKAEEFAMAAVAIGAKPVHIIFRHILPNVMAPVLVLASFNFATIILMEASLSFLGLGVQPPTPSWGSMISGNREYIYTAWWVITFPGLALMIMVLGINQLGDGLRDLLDPRLRGVL